MDSSTSSKAEVIKPVLLKAGIPLALSVAGFIYARIMANRSVNPKEASSSETDDQVSSMKANSPKFGDENNFRSFSSTTCVLSMEDREPFSMDTNVLNSVESLDIRDNKPALEEEISCLKIRLDDLQHTESELERQFIRFCELKEEQYVVMELRNTLALEMVNVEFLDREVASMEAERQRLEKFVVEYLRVVEQLQYWKSENGLLQRKVKKLLKKARRQSRVIREQYMKLEARDAQVLRINDVLETRTNVVQKLEDEIVELRTVLEQLQDENNQLSQKLELAEKSASSSISEIEGERIENEDYIRLEKELENLQKDRAAELKELIYLRWSNACLRHELMRNQAQQEEQHQEKNNTLEIDSEGSREFGNDELEHELAGMVLEHHNEPWFGILNNDQACSKRRKLFRRLKRWVEGSEKGRGRLDEKKQRHEEVKCFGRHSTSDDVVEHHTARRSCSSA